MGKWSRLAGAVFLDWLAAPAGLPWLDVGCGNGAFTALVVERSAPAAVDGIDPSDGQLAYARARGLPAMARFHQGSAMQLPFPDRTFGVAVMPLVIFFVPHPPTGVAEMTRVVRPGGIVAAYGWDLCQGGFPYDPMKAAFRELGLTVPEAPNPEASQEPALREMWHAAGLLDVETREIVVHRTFAGFDDYWTTVCGSPSMARLFAGISAETAAQLRNTMRQRLRAGSDGRITLSATANAVKGRRS